jgi:hypothetical protein
MTMISILFLAADPTNESRLRLGKEFREIQEKLQLAKTRDDISLYTRMSLRPTDIIQALLDESPNIIHFSGHGMSSGEICLENEMGEMHPVQPDALAKLFEQFSAQVDCVLLNACYSIIQAKAIAKHIRYVIGMRQTIGDDAAIAFSIGFYQALGAGRSVDEAYKLGCVQIRLQNIPEYQTPILIRDHDISGLINQVSSPLPNDSDKSNKLVINNPMVVRPINLGFEGADIGGLPDGWFNSLGFVDGVSTNYEINVIERPDSGNGACVVFQSLSATNDEFGSLMQRIPAKFLAGKVLRLEGELKTKNVEEWTGLWIRADGIDEPTLYFDNMYRHRIHGTIPWKKYTIDASLPQETAWLNYGIVLSGKGTIWADNFRLSVWEDDKWQEI